MASMQEAPWLRVAKQLPIGGSCRFRCCGTTKAAVLFNKVASWEGYCHRCKTNFFERKEYVRQVAVVPDKPVSVAPADVINLTDATAQTRQNVYAFLASKGLMPEMVENLKWSDQARRIIFPLFADISIARAMTAHQNPKWIQYNGRSTFATVPQKPQHVQGIVLTEDYLSALKVAHVSKHYGSDNVLVSSLLGTRLDAKLKVWIIENEIPVQLWLDGDAAGYDGIKRIKRLLKPYVPVADFTIDGLDPKDMSVQQILEGLSR